VPKKPGSAESAVITEVWLNQRTKGWEAVVTEAKRCIGKSTKVSEEVKTYYSKAKHSSIMTRIQKTTQKVHVIADKPAASPPKQSQIESESNNEFAPKEPKERREAATATKKRQRADEDEEEEDDEEEGNTSKNKNDLQRDALAKHSKMCDAAMSAMKRMKEYLEKLNKK